MGKKKQPFYRIVAADSRSPRDGRFIEMVGTYDPIAKPHKVDYKEERILHWLSNGAKPTDTVKSLFRGKGLWLKWTLIKQGADEAKIASEMAAWEKMQEEKMKRLEQQEAKSAAEKAKAKAEQKKEAEAEAAAAAPVEAEVASEPEPEVETTEAAVAEPKAEETVAEESVTPESEKAEVAEVEATEPEKEAAVEEVKAEEPTDDKQESEKKAEK